MPSSIVEEVRKRLPDGFLEIIDEFNARFEVE
jgi:hypothetical protein